MSHDSNSNDPNTPPIDDTAGGQESWDFEGDLDMGDEDAQYWMGDDGELEFAENDEGEKEVEVALTPNAMGFIKLMVNSHQQTLAQKKVMDISRACFLQCFKKGPGIEMTNQKKECVDRFTDRYMKIMQIHSDTLGGMGGLM